MARSKLPKKNRERWSTAPPVLERKAPPPGQRHRLCRECSFWYGAEDDEYGPCSLKTARSLPRFLTFGTFECDEGFTEPVAPSSEVRT